jgi:hypothetical protein
LSAYCEKAKRANVAPKYALPESERIYYKDFHFLEEPLIEKQQKKEEAKRLKKIAELQTGKSAEEKNRNLLPMFSN